VRLRHLIAYREERICRPLVLRAFSLFGPDELRKVEVADPGILDVLLTVIKTRRMPALDSLCAVAWSEAGMGRCRGFQSLADFINRYATTLTALDCPLPLRFPAPDRDRALARCTQLESLSRANSFAPVAWLGLTQLHTLRGVDLHRVPAAAIAAALPRLHTFAFLLMTAIPGGNVNGLFEDLLPRLRVLEFHGRYPVAMVEPRPLPCLQELVWGCGSSKDVVTRGFAGAQPVKLHVPSDAVADWLSGAEADAFCCCGPLALVRDLDLGNTSVAPADLTRLLLAAPELRKLRVSPHLMLTADDSAFAGLIHRRLRHLIFSRSAWNAAVPLTAARCYGGCTSHGCSS
jgi:hypothetical protein